MKHLLPLDNLVASLEKLPGIGKRSAERMALALVLNRDGLARKLADALLIADEQIGSCSRCGSITAAKEDPCVLCTDKRRENGLLCVVESPGDILKIETSGAFNGRYHVLGGHLSPALGRGVADLRVTELLARLQPENIQEVIVALGTDVESEATASYLAEILTSRGANVSRLAFGLPSGSAIEYADSTTLQRAIQGRQTLG
ncbi:MAG: recombination protein RecR [Verrucomicrobiota bacterium]|jgi:recombination protein RecR|nr:recombination protein RecR [Verrucomicrobiota bacterium]MDK2963517.1 recombination protein RecR [Verrucomicrobiota bacterium]